MKYAYARVSTRKQFRDGNGLDEQIEKLKTVGYDELVTEEFSGSTTKRPMLDSLIANLKSGDTLIVTKLDRLALLKALNLSMICLIVALLYIFSTWA